VMPFVVLWLALLAGWAVPCQGAFVEAPCESICDICSCHNCGSYGVSSTVEEIAPRSVIEAFQQVRDISVYIKVVPFDVLATGRRGPFWLPPTEGVSDQHLVAKVPSEQCRSPEASFAA
jgi:hypothetical protein